MSTEKHTPTPWIEDAGRILTGDGFKSCIANTNVLGVPQSKLTAEDKGNAAFIVRACNSHGALVRALEKCHAALQQFAVHNAEKEAMAEARAALKLAKENA